MTFKNVLSCLQIFKVLKFYKSSPKDCQECTKWPFYKIIAKIYPLLHSNSTPYRNIPNLFPRMRTGASNIWFKSPSRFSSCENLWLSLLLNQFDHCYNSFNVFSADHLQWKSSSSSRRVSALKTIFYYKKPFYLSSISVVAKLYKWDTEKKEKRMTGLCDYYCERHRNWKAV